MKISLSHRAIQRLIEANVEQLLAFDLEEPVSPGLEFYRQVLLAFHRGDLRALDRFIADLGADQLELLQEIPALLVMTHLRSHILSKKAEKSFLEDSAARHCRGPWAGEVCILLAAAYETLEDFPAALKFHKEAARELLKIGAKGKSLRARSNAVANLSNLEPERKLIPEYFYLFREAKKLKQTNIMATNLLNLSREYQKIGALRLALKFCNRALAVSKENFGGLIESLCIVHRGHLNLNLGRIVDARADLEQIRNSDFAVVKSAAVVLEKMLKVKQDEEPYHEAEKQILRTWQERLDEFTGDPQSKRTTLSSNEERLIQFLSEKSRQKFEITDYLYGADLHPFKAENRLKNLIHRVCTKCPGLIYYENDHYFLADIQLSTARAG
jgi:tetratricopeptide (TPR) repeat protein